MKTNKNIIIITTILCIGILLSANKTSYLGIAASVISIITIFINVLNLRKMR